MGLSKAALQRHRRKILVGVLGAAWLGLLLGVAIPSWRAAVARHGEIAELEVQLADLDRWTVAGLWLEKSLEPRREAIDPQWQALFPATPAKENLFLDLARVADTSGVGEFELKELATDTEPSSGGGEVPLQSYRVQARFEGRYADVARFLGGLRRIDRALTVHNLHLRPTREAVQVELELDVYVSAADRS